MWLGTAETIIVEAQMSSMLDEAWRRVKRVEMRWDDFKQVINNHLTEGE